MDIAGKKVGMLARHRLYPGPILHHLRTSYAAADLRTAVRAETAVLRARVPESLKEPWISPG